MEIEKEVNIDDHGQMSLVIDPRVDSEVHWSDVSSNEAVISAHQEDDVPLRGGDDKYSQNIGCHMVNEDIKTSEVTYNVKEDLIVEPHSAMKVMLTLSNLEDGTPVCVEQESSKISYIF